MGQPEPITWPIAATGIASKNAPFMLAAGGQLVLDNVRQERKDEWRTRAGFAHNTLDDLPNGQLPTLITEAPWGGFVGLCRQATYAAADRIYSPTAGTRWFSGTLANGSAACNQQAPSAWTRQPIAPMTTGNAIPSLTSTAQGGNYRITAWWVRSGGVSGFQAALQTIDGALVQSFPVFNSDAAAIYPRCVYSSTAQQLCLFYVDASFHVIAYTWNAVTGAAINVAKVVATTGFAGVPDSAYLDAIYYGGATVTLAYRNNTGTGNLEIAEYNPSTNTATTFPQGVDASKTLALYPDPDVSGIRMVGVGTATPDARVIRLNSVGVIQTNQVVDTVDTVAMTGVAYNAGVDWMTVYQPTPGSTIIKAVKRRSGVTSAVATIVPARAGMFTLLASGAWREPGMDTLRYLLFVSGATSADTQPTYHEMALDFENGAPGISNAWLEPQARLLPLNAGGPFGDRACLGQVQRLGTDHYLTALARVTQELIASDGQGGLQRAIDAWTVQYLNPTTYTNQNTGNGTQTQQAAFLPSGSLLQTATGQLLCAHGASALPFIPTLTPSVGAGALLNKTYVYGTTVSMPDEIGNEWRSPLGATASILLAGGNNTVTVAGALTPLENPNRRRVVMIWRTDGNATTFKLLHVIDSTVANTGTYSYVDTTNDVDTGEEYPFDPGNATGVGELEASLTPRLLHPTNWNGRLWGVDADFPNRVRFSKPLSTGLQPEFPSEFVIEVTDAFGVGTGLAAMDDKIVLFKKNAIYVAGGDGPGNDGSGQSYQFQLISSETGSLLGAPILSTGSEVYIVSQGGLFRVKRSQETDFVGAAIDRYLSMPLLTSPETISGMFLSPPQNEVRVQTTNYRFVHDRIFDIWIRDTGGMSLGIVMTRSLRTLQALFLGNGQMWIEAADSVTPTDAGTAFAGTIRTAWIRPKGAEGWLRLYRARALGECTAIGTVAQPTLTVFYDSSDALFESFQPRVSITATTGPIRAEGQVRRQKCGSFSLQITLPLGDATVRLDAWSATAEVLPGFQPISPNQKWGTSALPVVANCPPCTTFPGATLLPLPRVPTTPVVLTGNLLGTVVDNQRDLFIQTKNAWKAGGWFVVQSYNASGSLPAPGVDTWNVVGDIRGAGGGGTGQSWIVLGNPWNAMQLCFYCTVAGGGSGWLELEIVMGPAGGFTGGTIGARPTAPGELADTELPSALLGTGPVGNPQFYAVTWVAADGSYLRTAWIYSGHLKSFWQFDQLKNVPTGWTKNFVLGDFKFGNTDYTIVGNRASTDLFTKNNGSGGSWKMVLLPGPDTIEQASGSLQSSPGALYIPDQAPLANPFSGQYIWVEPLGFITTGHAAAQNGFWGWVWDQWWTVPSVFNDCDTAGDNHDFIIFNQMMLQWGLGVPGLGAASTNYASAKFNGRNAA